jgi:hypothetical protein
MDVVPRESSNRSSLGTKHKAAVNFLLVLKALDFG